jgi:hypothetical protein
MKISSNFQDLTGKTFGSLLVVERSTNTKHGSARWLCECHCGVRSIVQANNLKSGNTTRCIQCQARARNTHGMSRTKIYQCWQDMWARCRNPNDTSYENYGGRGIKVCERWETFENFLADMGSTYTNGLELDRVDNDVDYKPENCRWVTHSQNNRNKRNNYLVTYEGETCTMAEWSDRLGIKRNTLEARIGRLGWSIDRAFTKPVQKRSK